MFENFGDDINKSIEELSERKNFKKGDYLFHQNEVCRSIFLIKKGICRKFYLHDGKEFTTEFTFKDNYISSFKSFVLSEPTNEFAQALTDIETLYITKSNFDFLKSKYPTLQALDLRFVELYAIWLEDRLFQFQTQDAATRYLELIRKDPQIIQSIPLTYIASYLGVSLETLSRIRAKIAKNII